MTGIRMWHVQVTLLHLMHVCPWFVLLTHPASEQAAQVHETSAALDK